MADMDIQILQAASQLQAKAEIFATTSADNVSLQERPFLVQISLRGDASDKAFLAGVKKAIGFALPLKANSVTEKGEIAALWLAPDEWLIVSSEPDARRLLSTLNLMLSDIFHAAVDLSDNRTVLALAGPDSWGVLNKGTSLDFHPSKWKKGMCASSLYGAAQVIFWQRSAKPEFYLFVRNSFADYCATFLLDAMKEFTIDD